MTPVNGTVWLVRCTDTRGETFSRLFRQRPAAERHLDALEQAGGEPTLWSAPVTWTEVQP